MKLRAQCLRGIAIVMTALLAVSAIGGCRAVETGGAPALPEQPESLLILGDSIAEGYMDKTDGQTGVDPEACFGALLKTSWRLTADAYHNGAVSGWTTEDLLENLEDVTAGVKTPRVVALSVGGNDVLRPLMQDTDLVLALAGLFTGTTGRGAVSIWDAAAAKVKELSGKAAYTAAVENMKQNLDSILSALTKKYPDAFIVIQTLYNPLDRSEAVSVAIPLIDTINQAVREVAGRYGQARVLDVASAYAGHGAVYLSSDFIHPNRTGHERLAGLYEEWWETESGR